jgi:hypothetical protein
VRPLLLGALITAAAPAWAQERTAQYRELSLADGRSFIVTVLATEPLGVRVALPQGEMLVGFDMLQNMSTTTSAAYAAQPSWPVFLHSGSDETVYDLLQSIPGLAITRAGESADGMSPAAAEAATNCRGDVICIGDHVPAGTWVISVLSGEEGVDLIGVVSGSRTRVLLRGLDDDSASLWAATHEVLGLEVTGPAPKRRSMATRSRSVASVGSRSPFVPIPGFPAMGRDPARVGASWAVALPAAAAWIGVVGSASQSPAEHIALGLAGVYAITVGTNVAFMPRGLGMAIAPTEGGGAALTIAGRR